MKPRLALHSAHKSHTQPALTARALQSWKLSELDEQTTPLETMLSEGGCNRRTGEEESMPSSRYATIAQARRRELQLLYSRRSGVPLVEE